MYFKIASLLFIIGFAVFCLWNRLTINRMAELERRNERKFWEREREANSVRRKPIDHLDYIKIPDNLYFDLLPDHIETATCKTIIEGLRQSKILNLTGYTNTDLKMMYGTANITKLSEYDQNYTTLVTTLQKWADILNDNNYEKEAVEIMEFLISTNVDIGHTYRMLGKYYKKHSMEAELAALIERAENLKSINNSHIAESIREIM